MIWFDLKLFQNKYYNTIIINTHIDNSKNDPLKILWEKKTETSMNAHAPDSRYWYIFTFGGVIQHRIWMLYYAIMHVTATCNYCSLYKSLEELKGYFWTNV